MALSSTEMEYVAFTEVVKEGLWVRRMIGEIGSAQKTLTVHCDD